MESLIKIGPSVWAVEMTQTDARTDTLGSIATYSVKLTEYKNHQESPCVLEIHLFFFLFFFCIHVITFVVACKRLSSLEMLIFIQEGAKICYSQYNDTTSL